MASVVGALNPEVWAGDIADLIFPDGSFIMRSVDDTALAQNSRTVHLPQAGAAATVVEDRTSLPATAQQRTDTLLNYETRSYTTDPIYLRDAEAAEVSYDKRLSLMQDAVLNLQEVVAKRIGYEWGKTPQAKILTTGVNRAAEAPGATGNRKAMTAADFKAARAALNAQNIPLLGRVAVLTAQMYEDLTGDTSISNAAAFGKATLPTGVVDQLYGFDIMLRTNFLTFDTSSVAKVPGTSTATTDKAASLFYNERFVRRAKGPVNPFLRENDPLYYGSIMSFEAFAGGCRRYTSGLGIVALLEG